MRKSIVTNTVGITIALTLGLMLGQGNTGLAVSAGLLLAINLVCVNLASKVVFFVKGIRPRTWWEKQTSTRALAIYVLAWIVKLIFLVFVIYGCRTLTG